MTKYRVLTVMGRPQSLHTNALRLLFEHILPVLDKFSRQPERQPDDDKKIYQTDRNGWLILNGQQEAADTRILRHGMGDESLQIVGHAQTLEVSGNRENGELPAEHEHEAGDERPFQPRPDEREERAVGSKPDGKHA